MEGCRRRERGGKGEREGGRMEGWKRRERGGDGEREEGREGETEMAEGVKERRMG